MSRKLQSEGVQNEEVQSEEVQSEALCTLVPFIEQYEFECLLSARNAEQFGPASAPMSRLKPVGSHHDRVEWDQGFADVKNVLCDDSGSVNNAETTHLS